MTAVAERYHTSPSRYSVPLQTTTHQPGIVISVPARCLLTRSVSEPRLLSCLAIANPSVDRSFSMDQGLLLNLLRGRL